MDSGQGSVERRIQGRFSCQATSWLSRFMRSSVRRRGDENGMILLDQNVWDLDGMLWSNLPDGLEMPFDGMPNMDFDDGGVGYDGNYMMH